MGRWQREALTEGQGRYRRGPSTTCFASGPPPHGFATGRIERNSRSTRDFLAFEQRRDDLFDTPALDLGRRRQDDAVAKHPGGEALDVVGNDIIASIQRPRRPCGARGTSRTEKRGGGGEG